MKLFILSDCGVPTGYGRIADEIGMRLHKRGYQIMAASVAYDGLLPPQYEGTPLPYWVGSLAEHPNWVEKTAALINSFQPDVVLSIQDFPYHEALYNVGLDWSRMGRVLVTPVDGVPIYPNWLKTLAKADAALSISRFGVNAFREAGYKVDLCQPGIHTDVFFRVPAEERAALRAKLGIEPGAFVLGTAAMNQGRKAIPLMLRGFFAFAKDKPNARYLLDMDPQSAAGWDIPALCQQQGWDAGKLIFRADAQRAGLNLLRERYNVMDAHVVIAHREGFGLPLVEAMACGVVSMALDYCSGPEIVGEGRGCLIQTIDYTVPGTWGGAEDKFPDMAHYVSELHRLHDNPAERAAIAERGMAWARSQTWDAPTDAVANAIERANARRMITPPPQMPLMAVRQLSVNGHEAQKVELVEA